MKCFYSIFFFLLCQFSIGQQTEYVEFKHAKAYIRIHPEAKELAGEIHYEFEILKNVDSVYLDAKNFQHVSVLLDKVDNEHHYTGKYIIIKKKFEKGDKHQFRVRWLAMPKKAMYFIGWDNDGDVSSSAVESQVWTQGQGKYTSNWMPSIDDMNEKIEFDLSITLDKDYEVIANGKLTNKQINDSTATWHYDMQQPMSSYLVALAIGKYNKKVETSASGIPLEMYYYPHDSAKVEPTYRYTKQIFDFLEDEIGVLYPWQNYKQVPVKDFLYAGMENTGTTIFSDAFVVDSIGFVDRNYVNVNAHELAHQWFGNLVTAKHGSHHWLQEGFATYYALLAEREVFGEDYFYWKLHESAQQLLDQDRQGLGTSLLNPNSSSLTFYQKGAWTLYMLKEKIGKKAFNNAVKNYLIKHQFKNVETNDFISAVALESEQDLSGFVDVWLQSDSFPFERAMASLKHNSKFINEYLMVDCEVIDSKCDYYLTSYVSDEAKVKIISQIPERITTETFENPIKVRQAIARHVSKIPVELKVDYESLLHDQSYATIESALYNLWINFPEDRVMYLDQTKDVQGFNDKNVRTLWLALALVTPDYEQEKKELFFRELFDYTNPKYSFQLRQNAFQYLTMVQACDTRCKENLREATTHHNWRMVKFAKELLKQLN